MTEFDAEQKELLKSMQYFNARQKCKAAAFDFADAYDVKIDIIQAQKFAIRATELFLTFFDNEYKKSENKGNKSIRIIHPD